jgi:uncharacterized protein YyaL (SSP411 family)
MSTTPPQSSSQLAQWGEETLDLIQREFSEPNGPLYVEAVTKESHDRDVAFNWSAGVMLSALNSAARYDAKYKPWLRSFADATRTYWMPAPPVPGYDVLPNATSADRYYDDNAWMVMGLVETFEVLGDSKYLAWAEDALRFSLSGEDDKLGGGIYWKENGKTSKNTCSNAPVAAACLAVYRHDRNHNYLRHAERIYDWTKRVLQDPADLLMWDSVGVADGHVGKMKWTYNTALMIRAAIELNGITHKRDYLADAEAMQRASRRHWLSPQGALADDGPFAHLLLEAWIRADSAHPESPEAEKDSKLHAITGPLSYLHEHCRRDGFYGKRWEQPPAPDQKRFQLIDQAAAARAYFEAALSER